MFLADPTWVTAAETPPPAPPPYAQELQDRAAALGLADQPFWLRLLHMRRDSWGGGMTSQADGAGFFLAPEGKTDPRAELAATLVAFFTEALLPPGQMTAQCTFPARFRWLNERLHFDPARLLPQHCDRFEAWRAALDPGSVTLIFASYYLNNPSSIFGHTLLRLDKLDRPESQRLLDYAVNYAAAVPENDGAIAFAWRGIFGGYRGHFSVLPYYVKVREYNDLESRDLWEYRLALTPDQIDWLLRHAWELGSTYFDYYFFGENCSYHLLSLLEVANPELRLLERFPVWTLPTDTVRVVAQQPGLVAQVTYRPSRGSRMNQKLQAETPEERRDVVALSEGGEAPDSPALLHYPLDRRALLFDTAIDYHQYRMADDPHPPAQERAALRTLLLARSQLGSPYDPDAFPPQSSPPERGHASSRLGAALGGNTEDTRFLELSGYPSFHDLLSREDGYAPNSQIKLGELRARVESPAHRLRLERFAVADIVSLFTTTPLFHQPSWKVALGWQRNRDLGCEYCVPFFLETGIGLATETRWAGRQVWFTFLEGSGEFDRAFAGGNRAGFGVSAGVLLDVIDRWRAALMASRTAFTAGDATMLNRWTFQQRFTLAQDWEARLDWNGDGSYREALLALYWFF